MVPVTVHSSVEASPDCAIAVIAPIELSTVFLGQGPLPAVVATRDQTGPWARPGERRVLEFSDGSEAVEQLTAYEAPRYFAYRIDAFTGPLRLVVTHIKGEWWFDPVGDGTTRIRWTYAFCPTLVGHLLVRPMIAPLWRRYARRTLALMVQAVEGAARAPA